MWFKTRRAPPAAAEGAKPGLELLLQRADFARDAGDAEAAAALYAEVHARAPDRQDIKVQLGNMLKDSGRLREALAMYQNAQAVAPGGADICVQVGRCFKLLGDRRRALDEFRKAAEIDPHMAPAIEELAEAGLPWQQERRFEAAMRAGGAEAVMGLSRQLGEMRRALDAMAAMLPDALAHTAFPLASYAAFRALHAVVPPPEAARVPVTVVMDADRETPATLAAMVGAVLGQSVADWRLVVLAAEPDRRAVAARLAGADTRVSVRDAEGEEAVAEWRAARDVEAGWLLLLAPGAVLDPNALAWFSAAPAIGQARGYVCDEDAGRSLAGSPASGHEPEGSKAGFASGRGDAAAERDAPVLRQLPDYDTLLQLNTLGETLLVEAETFARLMPEAPEGSPSRARSRLLLDLAREDALGHIPLALVTLREPRFSSTPEHRLAVEAHATRHGFADRIAVAKGRNNGPTDWRPQGAAASLAVLVPTRNNGPMLKDFLRSLREHAAAPDRLSVVLADNGTDDPESLDILRELEAKSYVTRLSEPGPFNWARLSNRAAAATQADLLLFANDDMLMLTERWDERLQGLLDRDDVGAVGARLLYGDDTLQHGGILLGWKGGPLHDGLYEPAEAPGPGGRFTVTRRTGAVTGAFLATRCRRFEDLGAFDEVSLPVFHADVDYALRLRAAGLKVLWTPAVALRHFEGKTRGLAHLAPASTAPDLAERAVLAARWGDALLHDPSLPPTWMQATMPYRLLAAPPAARVADYIRRTARPDPWRPAAAQG